MNWTTWSRAKWHRKKKCKESMFKKSEVLSPFQVQQNNIRKKNLFIDPFKKIPASYDYLKEKSNFKEKTLPKGWRINSLPNQDTFGGEELLKNGKARINTDIEELTWKDIEFKTMLKQITTDDFVENASNNFNIKSKFSSVEPQIMNESQIKSKSSFSSAVTKAFDINEDFKSYVYGDKVRRSSINCFNDIDSTTKTNSLLACDLESDVLFNDSISFGEDSEDEMYNNTHSPFFKKFKERKSTIGMSEPMILSRKNCKNDISFESAKIFEQIVASEFTDYGEKFKFEDSGKLSELQGSRNNYNISHLNLRNHNSRDHLPFKSESEKENFYVESTLELLEPPAFFQRKKRRKNIRKQNFENVLSYSPEENELTTRVKNSNLLKTNNMSDSYSTYTQENINSSTSDLLQSNQRNNCDIYDKETVKVLNSQLNNEYQISVKRNLEQDTIQRPLQILTEESQSLFTALKRSLSSNTVSSNSKNNYYEGKEVIINSSIIPSNTTKCSKSSNVSKITNNLNINIDIGTIKDNESITSTTSEHMSELHNKEIASIIETNDSVLNVKDRKLFQEESKTSESVKEYVNENVLEKNVEGCSMTDPACDCNISKKISAPIGNIENYTADSLLTKNKSPHSQRAFDKISNCDIFLNTNEDPLCQISIPERDACNHVEINDIIVHDIDKSETLIHDHNKEQEIKIQESSNVSTTIMPSETTSLNYKPRIKSFRLEEKLKIDSKEKFYAANEAVTNPLNEIEETKNNYANAEKFIEDENASVLLSDSSSTDLFSDTSAKIISLEQGIDKKYSLKNIAINEESQEISSSTGKIYSGKYDSKNENNTTSKAAISVELNDGSSSNFSDENCKSELEMPASEYENCGKQFVKTNNSIISLLNYTNLKHKIDYFHMATQTNTETVDCHCQIDISKVDNSTQTMQS